MRLLCIYKHYYPDVTPYALILRGIAEHMAAEDSEVTVYTAQPSYNDIQLPHQPEREMVGGVDIIRAWTLKEKKKSKLIRLASFFTFLTGATWFAFRNRRKFDAIIFNMHPAILMGLTGRIIRRLTGIPFVYHCQDIQPESLRIAGRLKNTVLFRTLRNMDRRTSLKASRNVVLSNDMKRALMDRGVPETQISVIRNFEFDPAAERDDELLPLNEATRSLFSDDKFAVIFAGNFGNFQNLEEICQAAVLLKDESGIRFIFMGAGSAQKKMESVLGERIGKTVIMIPYQPIEVATAAMQRADLGIVSLHPGIYKVAFPSKTIMYLKSGCPILGIVEQESDLASVIRERSLGDACPQGDPRVIAEAIRKAYIQRDTRKAELRDRLRREGRELFSREQILPAWSELFAEILDRPTKPQLVSDEPVAAI